MSTAALFCVETDSLNRLISYNNVWGYTTSPLNRLTSSGGSSGGESALLAMRGAPFGVGTDSASFLAFSQDCDTC
jgi:amidase